MPKAHLNRCTAVANGGFSEGVCKSFFLILVWIQLFDQWQKANGERSSMPYFLPCQRQKKIISFSE